MRASVLTIAAGREDHLNNVVLGLCRQSVPPAEMIVARMQEAPYAIRHDTPFPVHQIRVTAPELPLAAARNAAAREAVGDFLIFVDVDCIPEPDLVAHYLQSAERSDGLLMGEVMYLPAGAASPGWSYDAFDAVAEKHSDRRGPPPARPVPCEDYRCFWSLNFGLPARTFRAVGGFDEIYRGYGGEDTDFGKTLSMRQVPLWWMRGGRVYHQHHPHHMPPAHHVRSVVRNAEIFEAKWGYRTMEHWLYAFRLMGLVEESPDGRLLVTRDPEPADLALTRQAEDRPYINTARVIRILKDRIEAERGEAVAAQ